MSEYLSGIFSAGQQVVEYWKGPWIDNATNNRNWTMRRIGKGRVYDAALYPKALGIPAWIIASGPSLDVLDWDAVRAAREAGAGLFCATSNLTAALARGLTPTHVVVVDANQSVPSHIIPYADDLKETVLVAPPIADPELFRAWKGPIAVFKPIQYGDDFTMNTLPKMYSYRTNITGHERHFRDALTVGFLNAGCYTNGAVLAADFFGYAPLFMAGNDLCFAYGRSRGTFYKRNGEWEAQPPHPPIARDGLRVARNGLRTTQEFLHYKLNLFIVWRLSQAHLYNVSPGGILLTDEVPLISEADALEHWRDADAGYPFDTESDEFHEHIKRCTERMGLTIERAAGGLQFKEVPRGGTPCTKLLSIGTPMMSQPVTLKDKSSAATTAKAESIPTGAPRT